MDDLAVLAVVLLGYGLVSRRLEAGVVTGPLAFVAAGVVAGPHVLGLTDGELLEGAGLILAEAALAFLLFSDAAGVDLRRLRAEEGLPARLLGIGMPLTIALGVGAGALLLGDMEFWEAAIVAAVLAPTDAALGQAVVTSERVPRRIRQSLNVEAGLNDGLSVPFVALFAALAVEEADPSAQHWLTFAAEQIGYGALIGAALGAVGGWLLARASARGLMTTAFEHLAVLALAVLAFTLADQAGGNGFIAAFAGGLGAGRMGLTGHRMLEFEEEEGQLLSLAVFFFFGVAAVDLVEPAGWEVVAYAALSLTVIRMVPVAVAVTGTGLRPRAVAFMGWFGPRGLASIVLVLTVAEEHPDLPSLDVVLATVAVTVLASVVLHGLTAQPFIRAYAREEDD
ncbi:MAG TPA: cation:proton antiporter [Thermoleophilaceae bacterium]|nr:cation:proton antiporter [Thermoleophilaceae bacterium]